MTEQPHLFTHAEWCALTDAERRAWAARRIAEVEAAMAAHNARQRLNDSLTLERFGRGDDQ
jgi:hypothetical protein